MITIDYRDSRPIYEQVVDGIEALALRGALPADTQLPSVRQLDDVCGLGLLARHIRVDLAQLIEKRLVHGETSCVRFL